MGQKAFLEGRMKERSAQIGISPKKTDQRPTRQLRIQQPPSPYRTRTMRRKHQSSSGRSYKRALTQVQTWEREKSSRRPKTDTHRKAQGHCPLDNTDRTKNSAVAQTSWGELQTTESPEKTVLKPVAWKRRWYQSGLGEDTDWTQKRLDHKELAAPLVEAWLIDCGV